MKDEGWGGGVKFFWQAAALGQLFENSKKRDWVTVWALVMGAGMGQCGPLLGKIDKNSGI
jgi:hypothetical protein